MPTIETVKADSDEEGMGRESPDSHRSSDDDSEMGSMDEDESELDEEECERRRNECVDDMTALERQFVELKEQLYRERIQQVDSKLDEVKAGRAKEFLNPLAQLKQEMMVRIQVAGIMREFQIQTINCKFESEELAATQNMQSEKIVLFDNLRQDLEDKIRRLEEDRHNTDISSDLWNETHILKKNKRKSDPMNPDRRRKPVTVSGPYIVYMLKDLDIIDDWSAIKKALKQHSQKRKSEL
ncbi:hypothetical protein ScPMuIL_013848 [Solemya velum]